MKNPELKNVSLDSEIHDNKLVVKPFSLKLNGLNTDIEGSNDITGGNLNYLVQIEFIPIDKIKVPFHVSGTYDNPKVTMGKGKKEN
jgi:AsmA protein